MLYKTEIRVKDNEVITWCIDQPWLPQFSQQVTNYIRLTRRKSSAHKRFANELKSILDQSTPENETAIVRQLIDKIANPQTLIERGRDKKKSFLYTLCQYGHLQYQNSKNLQEARQRIALETQTHSETQQEEMRSKDKQIVQLQAELLIANRSEAETAELLRANDQERDSAIKERQRLIARVDELSRTLASETDRSKKFEADNQSLGRSIQQLREELSDVRAQVADFKASASSLGQSPSVSADPRQEEFELLRGLAARATSEGAKLKAENEQLKQEVSHLRQAIQTMTTWLDRVFGTAFGKKIALFFEAHQEPQVSEDQARLIRKVASARPHDMSQNFKQDVENAAERLGKGVLGDSSKKVDSRNVVSNTPTMSFSAKR